MSDGEWFAVWLYVGGMGMAFGEFLAKVREREAA